MESFLAETFFALVLSYLLGRWLKTYFYRSRLVGQDVHKKGKPVLPTSGGIPVFLAFYATSMVYIFARTYLLQNYQYLLEVVAGVLSIALVTFVGFLDDINVSGGKRIGLKQWQKPLLTIWAAIPVAALRLGNPVMNLPLFGAVDFGVLYSLVIAPLAFMGASNMVNLLGGFNGLESGMGLIYLSSLSLFAYFTSNLAAKILAFGALGAVAGFFILNKFPAKFLPGDSFTYFLGGVLATIAIIGNLEKATVILACPFFIEFILKLRGKFKKPTVGKMKGGKIFRTDGIYSLPHFFMNGKYTEKQIVVFVWAISFFFSALIWVI